MAEVRLVNVSKTFDKINAVSDVTITIEDGEFFTLLGPSGCGKTTTLRMIAGLERPTSGRVLIGDRDVTDLPPKARNVAMVFQNYALYPHMTVAENIGYPLRIRNKPRREIEERTLEVARSLAIADLMQRRPAEISGGQQQRAALARAIVHEPNVFLFDEPLSNLDAKLRTDARTFLKHLQETLGITTVYVTHDQSEAMAMSDRIAVMDRGKVVQVGPPLDVYRHPANTFVAEFLGNPPMNLIRGTYEVVDGKPAVSIDGSSVPLSDGQPGLDRLAPGAEVILGIRPEDLAIELELEEERIAPEGARQYGIAGEVFVVEPLGYETLVSVKTRAGTVKVKTFEDLDVLPGRRVRLTPNARRLRLFDARGERIAC
ncbi:MAG: ABC transporter ATP-binding protein [Clostridia bacterium]